MMKMDSNRQRDHREKCKWWMKELIRCSSNKKNQSVKTTNKRMLPKQCKRHHLIQISQLLKAKPLLENRKRLSQTRRRHKKRRLLRKYHLQKTLSQSRAKRPIEAQIEQNLAF